MFESLAFFSKSGRVATQALAALALTSTLGGCPGDGGGSARISENVVVGARGRFTRQSGVLEVSVSPKDEDGNFVGQRLPISAFSFENVTLRPYGQSSGLGSTTVDVDTMVTDVVVSEPNPNAKLTGVVIFDSSGSMAGNDPGAVGRRAGGEALLEVMREEDEVAVLDFGAGTTSPLQASRLLQDFTSDHALLEASLDSLTESGGTPMYGSLLDGLSLLDPEQNPNVEEPAIILLTDGQASDAQRLEEAIDEAQRLTVPVFAIGLGESLDFTDLGRLSTETGGVVVEASDAMALEQAFAGISSGVRLGSVMVRGSGSYELPVGYTRFTVEGTLVTVDSTNTRFETPFSFTVDIE